MMKKKLLLFTSLALTLCPNVSQAKRVAQPLAAGQYLLYNVGAQKFLCAGNAWGTRASLGEVGILVELNPGGGKTTISTKPYYDKTQDLRKDGFLDQSTNQEYSFTLVEGKENTYSISFDDGETKNLYYDSNNSTLVSIGTLSSIDENAQWQLIKIETDDATEANPVDLSYLVRGADFNDRGNNRWKGTAPSYSHNNGDAADRCAEFYNKTYDMYQELTGLPNGSYKVQCLGFYRNCGTPATAYKKHTDGSEKLLAELYAGDQSTQLKSVIEGAGKNGTVGTSTDGGNVPNSMTDAESYFANTPDSYLNELEVVVKDGTLKLGIRKTTAESNDWTIFDKFRLYYKGISLDMAKEIYETNLTTAKEQLNNSTYSGSEKVQLSNLINATIEENVESYKAATTKLLEAVSTLQSAEKIYTTYQKQIDEMVTTAKALGVDDADSYKLTITETTTAAELQEKLNAVKVAQYNKVESLGYSEVTSLAGLTFSGWDNANQFGNTDYRNVWNGTGKGDNAKAIYYEKTGGWGASDWTIAPTKTVNLPAGKYVAKLACRTSTNATGTVTVKEGENTLSTATFPIKNDNGFGINTSGAASFNESDNFANSGKGYGWEWRFLPFELTEDADVTFTIDLAVEGNHQYPGFTALDLYTTVNDITLDETSSNTIESGFANVTLKRKLTTDVWNSLVLPFSMTKDQVKSVFGYNGNESDGTMVATFSDATLNENNYTLKFAQQKNGNAVITANTPCLIRPKTGASEYTIEGVRMEPSTNNLTVEHNGVSFIGSYDNAGLPITKNDYFLASDNNMYRAAGTETMKGFRAVFRVNQDETQEAKTLSVSFDDETTGITTVKANNNNAIYNIAGQLVKEASSTEGLQKGVYIVNGKKVIIK